MESKLYDLPWFTLNMYTFRDGPFDIQGGGLVFFLATHYFFSLFAQQVIFFKSKLQQVFYFFESNTIKSEKCKESNKLNEKP